jgi:hypothetical protein
MFYPWKTTIRINPFDLIAQGAKVKRDCIYSNGKAEGCHIANLFVYNYAGNPFSSEENN